MRRAIKKQIFEMHCKGFTLVEAIIASVLFVLVAGGALVLLTHTMSSYSKGESTSTSVQEAALLVNRIRTDLLQSTYGPQDRTFDYFNTIKSNSSSSGSLVLIDHLHSTISSSTTSSEENGHMFKFYVNEGTTKKLIQYTYKKEEKSIVRKAGTGKNKSYAVPRLQDFSISLLCQPKPSESSSATSTAPPELLFHGTQRTQMRIAQIWFKIMIRMKEDEKREGRTTREVHVESLIFPKQLNTLFQSQWKEWQ